MYYSMYNSRTLHKHEKQSMYSAHPHTWEKKHTGKKQHTGTGDSVLYTHCVIYTTLRHTHEKEKKKQLYSSCFTVPECVYTSWYMKFCFMVDTKHIYIVWILVSCTVCVLCYNCCELYSLRWHTDLTLAVFLNLCVTSVNPAHNSYNTIRKTVQLKSIHTVYDELLYVCVYMVPMLCICNN